MDWRRVAALCCLCSPRLWTTWVSYKGVAHVAWCSLQRPTSWACGSCEVIKMSRYDMSSLSIRCLEVGVLALHSWPPDITRWSGDVKWWKTGCSHDAQAPKHRRQSLRLQRANVRCQSRLPGLPELDPEQTFGPWEYVRIQSNCRL